jgi:chromosome partitioning protein
MHVLSLISQKGGTGKSTLTFCLAVAAEQSGRRVLILDMDPQGTAEAWFQDREEETPLLVRVSSTELESALTKAAAKFDLAIIDTPGRDEPATVAAIRAADFCLIPCRPSPGDLKACPPTAAAAKRLNKPTAFVLTQTPPRGYRIREAERGLSILGPVCPVHIVSRSGYQDAQGLGLGVTEYDPEGKAAFEIKKLWNWLDRKMGKLL